MQLTNNPHYYSLLSEAQQIKNTSLKDLMKQDNRENDFCFALDGLWIDISRHFINKAIFDSLIKLADASGVQERFSALDAGNPINYTEDRAVSHTQLRKPKRRETDEWQKLSAFSEALRASQNIQTIINIGIGGSDLGPSMVASALRPFQGKQKYGLYLILTLQI